MPKPTGRLEYQHARLRGFMKVRPTYYIYIMGNRSGTLYVGVTNDLERRIAEHRARNGSRFTQKYHLEWLVYCEEFRDILGAIEREKQIKRLSRAKKIALVERMNPEWRDLAREE